MKLKLVQYTKRRYEALFGDSKFRINSLIKRETPPIAEYAFIWLMINMVRKFIFQEAFKRRRAPLLFNEPVKFSAWFGVGSYLHLIVSLEGAIVITDVHSSCAWSTQFLKLRRLCEKVTTKIEFRSFLFKAWLGPPRFLVLI